MQHGLVWWHLGPHCCQLFWPLPLCPFPVHMGTNNAYLLPCNVLMQIACSPLPYTDLRAKAPCNPLAASRTPSEAVPSPAYPDPGLSLQDVRRGERPGCL